MRRRFAPTFCFARRFDGGANILAVAKGRFSEQTPIGSAPFDAVTRIRPRLFAANVQLHSAIHRGSREIDERLRRLIDRQRCCMDRRRVLEPYRLDVFEKPLPPTPAAATALAIPAPPPRSVGTHSAIHPNHAGTAVCP